MPYITSIERLGLARGIRKGVASLLKVRFGDEGLKLMLEINEIHDEEQLETILNALETADSPDDVRRIWAPESP